MVSRMTPRDHRVSDRQSSGVSSNRSSLNFKSKHDHLEYRRCAILSITISAGAQLPSQSTARSTRSTSHLAAFEMALRKQLQGMFMYRIRSCRLEPLPRSEVA
jgi:hypothetical protein